MYKHAFAHSIPEVSDSQAVERCGNGGIRWFAWGNHGKEAFFGDVAEFRCPKRRRKSESFGVPIFASSIRESVEI